MAAEREAMTAQHGAELAEAARQSDARCAGMAAKHARASELAARQADAQLQRLTLAHEMEQVGCCAVSHVEICRNQMFNFSEPKRVTLKEASSKNFCTFAEILPWSTEQRHRSTRF